MNVLEVSALRGGYTEVDILQGIDLAVKDGEIVTVAGTNGAGKSTLVKAIAGLLPRVSGQLLVHGDSVAGLSAERRAKAGIGYVPQVANVFPSLTILENLNVVAGVAERTRRVQELFEVFPVLREKSRVRAAVLSGGERQQLAFARALMSKPRLMLLDEPTAALSPEKVTEAFALVRRLPALGAAVLIVEQRARQSLAISDRGCILDAGRVAMAGAAATLLDDPKAAALYLGQRPH